MARLTFLGSGGSVVSAKRACSGFLFEDKLVDVGFGVLVNVARSKFDVNEINSIYISHTHSDHIGDFTGLIWTMAMKGRTKPLSVVSSSSTASSLKEILVLQSTPKSGFVKFEIRFITPAKANVETLKTIHDPENLAFKFKVGSSKLVYSGDTLKYDRLSKFASKCDMLIHESTFLSQRKELARITKHSTAFEAGEIAREAKVGELVLTHFAPGGRDSEFKKEALGSFRGKVTLAEDLLTLDL